MSSKKNKIPRGIRNNNPLNLRVGNNWIGEVSEPTDPAFEQFKEMKWGVRAAFIVMKNYINRHKCNTVAKLISRWAPNNENNTKKYIETVYNRTGLMRGEVLNFDNQAQMMSLFSAMCWVENGQSISVDDIYLGYLYAKGVPEAMMRV